MKNNCIFCAIAAGEIPSFKVYEDDETLATIIARVKKVGGYAGSFFAFALRRLRV